MVTQLRPIRTRHSGSSARWPTTPRCAHGNGFEANGMTVLRASNAAEAKRIVLDLIRRDPGPSRRLRNAGSYGNRRRDRQVWSL